MIPNSQKIVAAYLLVGTLLLTATVASAQEKKPPKPSWPRLEKAKRDKGEKFIQLLRSKRAKVRTKAIDNLVAMGLGMADRMFRRMSDSPYSDINAELAHVLDQILRPKHTPLIALHRKHRSVFARRYVMKTLCKFAQKDSVPVFKAGREDKDVEVSYYASLGLVKTTKDLDALDAIFNRCLDEWGELQDEVTRNLVVVRGDHFLGWIRKKLAADEIQERVTALRIMRSIAPAGAKRMVRPFLDSEHSIIKKEAINTLRVIVDGKPAMPLKKITVFLAIKMAQDWRKRL